MKNNLPGQQAGMPRVSCIMPTANRRQFVPLAVRYFLDQDYVNKELIILDDGNDPVRDLILDHPDIRYYHESTRRSLGAKRNRLCELASGELIAHWDDDDWYSSERLSVQVEIMRRTDIGLCGINRLLYFDLNSRRSYEYHYRANSNLWLSMLCYWRSLWRDHRFPDVQVGSDTRFLWSLDSNKMAIVEQDRLNVCFIHGTNVAPKKTSGSNWKRVDESKIAEVLQDKWPIYRDGISALADRKYEIEQMLAIAEPRAANADCDKWIVIVPTYNRPDALALLLDDIERESSNGVSLDVRIYDDASTVDYGTVRLRAGKNGWAFVRADKRHGKALHWQWVSESFKSLANDSESQWVLFIHDDYRLCDRFFHKASTCWNSIADPKKLALTVAVNQERLHKSCWTGFDPVPLGDAVRIQWVDGAFVAPVQFFTALSYQVPQVSAKRWNADPTLSSGVGRNISVLLSNRGYGLYRTGINLATHAGGASMLNGSANANSTLSNKLNSVEPSRVRKWVVVITTYQRPLLLLELLHDFEREDVNDLDVRVYDDASSLDYSAPAEVIRRNGWVYRRAAVNHGKQKYWRWITSIYQDLKALDEETLVVFLQDDVRLCKNFFGRADAIWQAIDHSKKATLNLLIDSQRENSTCWTRFRPRRTGTCWNTQWVDQIFVADRNFFTALDYAVPEVPADRWNQGETLSSGVGQGLSVKLNKKGWKMFRVDQSLVAHVDGPSVMNQKLRSKEYMTTLRFVDGDVELKRIDTPPMISASIATIPNRQALLERVVRSLLPQVDRLNVYLNDYDRVPGFLQHAKIITELSSTHGNRSDAGKFFWTDLPHGYVLTCDDDIIYPSDYVDRTIAAIERYQRRAVVGYHGILLNPKVTSYYRDRTVLHFSQAIETDTYVHIVGTGCCAWHTSSLRYSHQDFKSPEMADIWFALACQRQRVPMITATREKGWLEAMQAGDTIYNRYKNKDGMQTEAINNVSQWQYFEVAAARGEQPSQFRS